MGPVQLVTIWLLCGITGYGQVLGQHPYTVEWAEIIIGLAIGTLGPTGLLIAIVFNKLECDRFFVYPVYRITPN